MGKIKKNLASWRRCFSLKEEGSFLFCLAQVAFILGYNSCVTSKTSENFISSHMLREFVHLYGSLNLPNTLISLFG